jgi:hypothetical protein
MRLIVNGSNRPVLAIVPGRKPTVIGATEMVWPPKTIVLEALAVTPIASDMEADAILERHGNQGVIEVVGLTPQEGIVQAQARRLDYLTRFIDAFRENNALRRAQNNDILMPRQVHREALREIKALRAILATEDAELLGDVDAKQVQRVEDIMPAELQHFGITQEVMPLTPNVPPALSDIDI